MKIQIQNTEFNIDDIQDIKHQNSYCNIIIETKDGNSHLFNFERNFEEMFNEYNKIKKILNNKTI
jgi:hypothetical protein